VKAVAGIDVGGSGIRVKVRTGEREVAFRLETPPHRDGATIDATRLADLLRDSLGIHGAAGLTFATIAIGMTGLLDPVEQPVALAEALARRVAVDRVIVARDCLTTHLGVLDTAAGTVVAAGTGAVALGTDLEDIWHEVDGWGILLGDSGSGAWVGREGLVAAIRAHDGHSDASPLLLDALKARFGDPRSFMHDLYLDNAPTQVLASFAPDVALAARRGDPVAAEVWHRAGVLLARTAVTAAREVEGPISWGGGLFQAGGILIEPFRQEVATLAPDVELRTPVGNSVDGALFLAATSRTSVLARSSFVRVFDVGASA